jgi:hypothetical protein
MRNAYAPDQQRITPPKSGALRSIRGSRSSRARRFSQRPRAIQEMRLSGCSVPLEAQEASC